MPWPKKAVLFIRIWSRLTCSACSCQFVYLCRKIVPASFVEEGATPEGVEAFYLRHHGVTYCPCPFCGRIEPNMVVKRRKLFHLAAMAGGALLAVVMIILNVTSGRSAEILAGSTVSMMLAALIGHLYGRFGYDPNKDVTANRKVMRGEVKRGRVRVLQKGSDDETPRRRSVGASPKAIAGWLLLVAGPPVALASLVVGGPAWLSALVGVAIFTTGGGLLVAATPLSDPKTIGQEIHEVNSTYSKNGTVPEDFEDIACSPVSYKTDWPLSNIK